MNAEEAARWAEEQHDCDLEDPQAGFQVAALIRAQASVCEAARFLFAWDYGESGQVNTTSLLRARLDELAKVEGR
jgi:hypothetical protein